ncbi:hypothetical protein KSS87_021427 [Heliosperma pusillum]|nr:hypothetical protein KSS87_021427 [Heliosperma pusillum]
MTFLCYDTFVILPSLANVCIVTPCVNNDSSFLDYSLCELLLLV